MCRFSILFDISKVFYDSGDVLNNVNNSYVIMKRV